MSEVLGTLVGKLYQNGLYEGFTIDKEKINTWADIINRANLGMEVMHERNAHNFPLDLAGSPICKQHPII